MIEELRSADTDAGDVPFLDGERTPAGLSGWRARYTQQRLHSLKSVIS